jgi:signal transduction histidine kinase/CheY-like chemotaxis protein
MAIRILTVLIKTELDVVAARQRARQIAALSGFSVQDQAKIATAVSELTRNIYNYADSGKLEFFIEGDTSPQLLLIRIEDKGPGIPNLDAVLAGDYRSNTGMGVGILGSRRLMDQFDIQSTPNRGTRIVLKKLLPATAPVLTARAIGEIGANLAALPTDVTLAEVEQQNKELLSTLAELKARQEELLQLTRELEDTNRGVVALYAELDETADHLRRADEMKSRFLSNMSHEFRTPLSSIRALAKLLLERTDGELSEEQEKQVRYILTSGESLSDLVDDLLDLAKIEAGKIDVRPSRFDPVDMFSALRGMLRPLLVSDSVKLVFQTPEHVGVMYTDEAKLSQILRNFISNALKFTETGEVVVSAAPAGDGWVRFSVRDTGVGIAKQDQELIFEEFSQIESRLQGKVKGTGLGLPLCRKLANVLKGRVELHSEPGRGSIFSVLVPSVFEEPEAWSADPQPANEQRFPVLVVEDCAQTRMVYGKLFAPSEFLILPARGLWEAEQVWAASRPAAVLLDICLEGENAWHWLSKTKADPQRSSVPVVVITAVDDRRKALALGADAFFLKPVPDGALIETLRNLVPGQPPLPHAGQRQTGA